MFSSEVYAPPPPQDWEEIRPLHPEEREKSDEEEEEARARGNRSKA